MSAIINNMRFLSVNIEGQSPTCPTTKNQDKKFIRAASPPNWLFEGLFSIYTMGYSRKKQTGEKGRGGGGGGIEGMEFLGILKK